MGWYNSNDDYYYDERVRQEREQMKTFKAQGTHEMNANEYKDLPERDPNGVPAFQPGSKLDAGKSPVWQGLLDYFPRAVLSVASLSDYGASKYSWKGWEKVVDGEDRYRNAMQRHVVKEAIEGPWDLDAQNDPLFPAKVLHRTQIAWNAMAALELMLRKAEQEQEAVERGG